MSKNSGEGTRESATKMRRRILAEIAALLADRPFEAITLSDIAQHVRCSKATLYLHFNSREELLMALCEQLAVESDAAIVASLESDRAVAEQLTEFANLVMQAMLSESSIALQRLLWSDLLCSPNLVRQFLKLGPKRYVHRLTQYLGTLAGSNALSIPDTQFAAESFIASLLWPFQLEIQSGARGRPTKSFVDHQVADAVRHFMAAITAGDTGAEKPLADEKETQTSAETAQLLYIQPNKQAS